jgi:hypothetical protein
MAVLPAVIMAASAVIGAVAVVRQGQAAKAASEFNAKMADRNREIAKSQTDALSIQQRRQAIKQLGSMRAGYGASGVTLEGSPLDVLEESVAEAELENQNIHYQGLLKQQGYQADAGLDRANGRNAARIGYLKGASGLLSAAGTVAGGMNGQSSGYYPYGGRDIDVGNTS